MVVFATVWLSQPRKTPAISGAVWEKRGGMCECGTTERSTKNARRYDNNAARSIFAAWMTSMIRTLNTRHQHACRPTSSHEAKASC